MRLEAGLGLWGMQAFILHPRHHVKLYQEMVEEARWADELGFDALWLTEHHVWFDGYVPQLLTAVGAVAAATSRIRIGTSCLLLPMHDPLRVAEAAAMADIVSGGRLELGVAVGYRDLEFDTFGIARSQRASRMEEMLDILHLAWTKERFSYQGRHFQYKDVRLTPKPIQRPIPIWMGGWAPAVVRRAGRRRLHLMGARPQDWHHYEEAARQASHDPQGIKMTVGGDVWVAEDEEEAKAFIRPIAKYLYYDQLGGWGFFADPVLGQPIAFDRPDLLKGIADAMAEGAMAGRPETVREQLRQRLQQCPPGVIPHLFMRIRFDTAPRDKMRRCMELLAREVISPLREEWEGRP
jgi:alkanesulfonate monooxygenase SsuD/methylene tetrahydromethanopterin reductase-like flavin-dependent oxidoreductase (luciferase family)